MKWIGRICLASIISIGLIFCGCGNTSKVSNAKETKDTEFTSNLRLLEEDLVENMDNIKKYSRYGAMWVYIDPETKCEYLLFTKYDDSSYTGGTVVSITPRYEMINNQIRIKQKF